jgi:hypothetical protein
VVNEVVWKNSEATVDSLELPEHSNARGYITLWVQSVTGNGRAQDRERTNTIFTLNKSDLLTGGPVVWGHW